MDTSAPAADRAFVFIEDVAARNAREVLDASGMNANNRPIDIDVLADEREMHVKDDAVVTEVQQRGDTWVTLIAAGTGARSRRWTIARGLGAQSIFEHNGIRIDEAFAARRRGDDAPLWIEFSNYVEAFSVELLIPAHILEALWHYGYSVAEIASVFSVSEADITDRMRRLVGWH